VCEVLGAGETRLNPPWTRRPPTLLGRWVGHCCRGQRGRLAAGEVGSRSLPGCWALELVVAGGHMLRYGALGLGV
jgi:hypothetical protein